MQGILCFLAERQLWKLRLGEGAIPGMPRGHYGALRATLIEIVDDLTGAGKTPSAAADSGSRAGMVCGIARL